MKIYYLLQFGIYNIYYLFCKNCLLLFVFKCLACFFCSVLPLIPICIPYTIKSDCIAIMAYLICDGVIAVVVVSFVPKSSKLKTWEMAQEVFKKFVTCWMVNNGQWILALALELEARCIGVGVHRFATYQHSFVHLSSHSSTSRESFLKPIEPFFGKWLKRGGHMKRNSAMVLSGRYSTLGFTNICTG